MDRYLLDTNIVSFLNKGGHPALDDRVRALPNSRLALSAVTEAEIRFGLKLLPPEAKIHSVAERSLSHFQILPWDSACAQQYALLAARQQRLGKPLATMDLMIAAHALAHEFVLVSNDAAFRHVKGLQLEDWTKGPRRA